MKKVVLSAIGIVLLAAGAYSGKALWNDPAWKTTQPVYTELPRQPDGGSLMSSNHPAARIVIADGYEYLGGQKFELYGTVTVDQYFYVLRCEGGDAQSIIRLQFESILPGVDGAYDYSSDPLRMEIDGLDFFTVTEPPFTRSFLGLILPYGKPGTDGYRANSFLASQGISLPDETAYARLVHIPDEEARNEMIIFFYDDIGALGFEAEDFQPDGVAADRWDAISKGLLDKIERTVSIDPLPEPRPDA